MISSMLFLPWQKLLLPRSSLIHWQDFTLQLLNSVFFFFLIKRKFYDHASFSLDVNRRPFFFSCDHIHPFCLTFNDSTLNKRTWKEKKTQNVSINKCNSEEKIEKIKIFLFPNLLKKKLCQRKSQENWPFLLKKSTFFFLLYYHWNDSRPDH